MKMESDTTLYRFGRWSRREADDFPPLSLPHIYTRTIVDIIDTFGKPELDKVEI